MRAQATASCVLWTLVLLSGAGIAAAADDLRLVEASERQEAAAVRALLKQGVDVNARQADGVTALHWAAHWDDLATANLLILAGAHVDAADDYGISPLVLASRNGSAPMVERLLTARANPNAAVSTTGETPLMAAARAGNVNAVKALLAHGADVNATELSRGQTALMWAAAEKHAGVVRALIEQGADVHARSKIDEPAASSMPTPTAPTAAMRSGGFTSLMFAARQGDVETARILLDAGARIEDTAADGSMPLLVATVRGHVALAKFFLERGANPNANGAGYTALHWAAGSWDTELTGVNGIRPERDEEWVGMSGLRIGQLELVKALLAHGADPNARLARQPPRVGFGGRGRSNPVGATPFWLAAAAASADVMRVLVAHGADPVLATNDNTTPLMVAAGLDRLLAISRVTESSALEATRLALELGGDVNAANNDGQTALHGAAFVDAESVARLLVEKGAAVNAKNARGQTPLKVAEVALVSLNEVGAVYRTRTGDFLRSMGGETEARDSAVK